MFATRLPVSYHRQTDGALDRRNRGDHEERPQAELETAGEVLFHAPSLTDSASLNKTCDAPMIAVAFRSALRLIDERATGLAVGIYQVSTES
jgi:hypothetical protein